MPSLALKNTRNILVRYLDEMNMNYNSIKCYTGIVALITSNYPITIGIRADMDSLPIEEKCNIDYKSENKGIMHACSYDGIDAIVLHLI